MSAPTAVAHVYHMLTSDYMQTLGTYLHHTVLMVGLPDRVLLIFLHVCTCIGTLVPVLPVEVCFQNFSEIETPEVENSTVIDKEQYSLSITVEFFRLRFF